MLSFDFQAVLKGINEEVAELASAVHHGSTAAVCKAAAATIYHTLLMLVVLKLDLAALLHSLKLKADGCGSLRTLGILEPPSTAVPVSMEYRRNSAFVVGGRVGFTVNVTINGLYHAVFCLTPLCTGLKVSARVDACAIYCVAIAVFTSLTVLLR
ncbi:MAG: hypothetical protein ACKERG_00120 [Candidatus Hodgkinia cicadicola]